jgi:broad specificity phosphatase PhoE
MLLVLLLRHAESTSNVGDDVEDPALTDVGVAQADAWRERASHWSLDAIVVSPMLRCVATAARALGACNCSRWEVCPAAREHWWMHKQNRGRLAAELLPDLVELPSHGLAAATIESAVGAPSEHWDPVDETNASNRALGRRSAVATLALVSDLCARADRGAEKKLAVVCHWGVIASSPRRKPSI